MTVTEVSSTKVPKHLGTFSPVEPISVQRFDYVLLVCPKSDPHHRVLIRLRKRLLPSGTLILLSLIGLCGTDKTAQVDGVILDTEYGLIMPKDVDGRMSVSPSLLWSCEESLKV